MDDELEQLAEKIAEELAAMTGALAELQKEAFAAHPEVAEEFDAIAAAHQDEDEALESFDS